MVGVKAVGGMGDGYWAPGIVGPPRGWRNAYCASDGGGTKEVEEEAPWDDGLAGAPSSRRFKSGSTMQDGHHSPVSSPVRSLC